MNVSKLLLVFLLSTSLSSCGRTMGILGDDTAQDIKEIKSAMKTVNAYFTGQRTENPCVVGVPQTAKCYYVMTITSDDYATNGLRAGKTSGKVCDQNKVSGHPLEDCTKFNPGTHHFPVKGSPPMQKNSDYEFVSQVMTPPTSELICVVMDDTTGNSVERCEPRTTALPQVK